MKAVISTLRSSSASGISGSSSGFMVCWGLPWNAQPNMLLGHFQRWEAVLCFLVWGHFCCHYIFHRSFQWFHGHSSACSPFYAASSASFANSPIYAFWQFGSFSWCTCWSLHMPLYTSLGVWLIICHLSSSSVGARLLDTLPLVWCNLFIHFPSLLHPQQVILAPSKMFLTCFHCWFTESSSSLPCTRLGTRSSTLGQKVVL